MDEGNNNSVVFWYGGDAIFALDQKALADTLSTPTLKLV